MSGNNMFSIVSSHTIVQNRDLGERDIKNERNY